MSSQYDLLSGLPYCTINGVFCPLFAIYNDDDFNLIVSNLLNPNGGRGNIGGSFFRVYMDDATKDWLYAKVMNQEEITIQVCWGIFPSAFFRGMGFPQLTSDYLAYWKSTLKIKLSNVFFEALPDATTHRSDDIVNVLGLPWRVKFVFTEQLCSEWTFNRAHLR